jgi:cob(I)alamin adenosyltransferase
VIATIFNALAHHGLAVGPDIAADHLTNLNSAESRRWLQEQMDRITAELGLLSAAVLLGPSRLTALGKMCRNNAPQTVAGG